MLNELIEQTRKLNTMTSEISNVSLNSGLAVCVLHAQEKISVFELVGDLSHPILCVTFNLNESLELISIDKGCKLTECEARAFLLNTLNACELSKAS